jgi:predicted ATP-dependent endonuclease of OLD family
MRFTRFEFKNFRGIPSGSFDLSKSAEKAVHVLVGLNESGKTTILEGKKDQKESSPSSDPRDAGQSSKN